jgi:hypothetical protein
MRNILRCKLYQQNTRTSTRRAKYPRRKIFGNWVWFVLNPAHQGTLLLCVLTFTLTRLCLVVVFREMSQRSVFLEVLSFTLFISSTVLSQPPPGSLQYLINNAASSTVSVPSGAYSAAGNFNVSFTATSPARILLCASPPQSCVVDCQNANVNAFLFVSGTAIPVYRTVSPSPTSTPSYSSQAKHVIIFSMVSLCKTAKTRRS